MGGVSSNLHAIFFEIDDVLTKNEKYKNTLEINLGPPNKAKIKGCDLVSSWQRGDPYNGGEHKINLHGIDVQGECDHSIHDRILDNEKYFSTCFLVPKDLKIKDDGGKDISDKCSLVYKTEIQCEGDDEPKNLCAQVNMDGTPEENEERCSVSTAVDRETGTKWDCVYSPEDNICKSVEVEEPFTNLKNDNNDIFCIFIATIILALFITIKRKNF